MHVANGQRTAFRDAVKRWQAVKGDIQLARRAPYFEIFRFLYHVYRQVRSIHHIEKGTLRIEIRDHNIGVILIAILQGDTNCPAIPDQDTIDIRIAENLSAKGLIRLRKRTGDGTHTAAGESPGADIAVNVSHVMMQEHIGCTRGVNPQRCADNTAAGQVRLDDISFEIFLKVIAHTLGPEFQRVGQALLSQGCEAAGKLGQIL